MCGRALAGRLVPVPYGHGIETLVKQPGGPRGAGGFPGVLLQAMSAKLLLLISGYVFVIRVWICV